MITVNPRVERMPAHLTIPRVAVVDERGATDPAVGSGDRTPVGATAPAALVRPTWRGLIHRYSVLAYVPLFGLLVALTSGLGDRIAVTVYALGVTVMLGVSATYHSGRLGPVAVRRMKRVDHSTILLAIAASYTAIATLALSGGPARWLLVFTWGAALAGMVIRMAWLRAPYPVVALVYVVVGWGALLQWGALDAALTTPQMALLLGGGLLYTAGAVVYAAHRPNPWPATFGYHEVFHALVAGGVSAHYLLTLALVLHSR